MASNLWNLNLDDWTKGLIMAVIGFFTTALYSALETGSLESINWQTVLKGTILAGLAYIIKNLGTGSGGKILINNSPEAGK